MSDTAASSSLGERPRALRWLWRGLFVLTLFAALVWALPMIAALSPCRDWLAAQLGQRINGTVRLGGASLGWFSPIVLRDVEVCDAAGRRLASVAELETDRTLFGLLRDHEQLGMIRLRKPAVEVVFAGSGSNVEQVLAAELLPAPQPGAAKGPHTLPSLRLEISDGSVKVTDADRNKHWTVKNLDASLACSAAAGATLRANVQAAIDDGVKPGSLKVEGALHNLGTPEFRVEVKGKFDGFPLSLVGVVARRYQASADLAGYLEGQGQVTTSFAQGKLQLQVVGEVVGSRCQLDAPPLAERLCLDEVKLPCRLRLDGTRLTLEQAELTCDVGKASLRGTFDLGQAPEDWLNTPGAAASLHVDASKLAARLPRTLRLRPDLRVTAGVLNLDCTSQAGPGGVAWQGRLETTDLRGVKGTRTVAWTDPVNVVFRMRGLGAGLPQIDQLHCASRFLKMDAHVAGNEFVLQADADLEKLAEPLSEFVDLGALRLAGHAGGKVTVRRLGDDRYAVEANGQGKHLHVTGPAGRPWREDVVAFRLSAQGRLGADGRQHVETGKAALQLGADAAAAELRAPIADLAAGPWGLLDLRLEGDLARWQQRARALTTLLDDWRLAGTGIAQLSIRPTRDLVECQALHATLRGLVCESASVWVHEPQLDISATGRWRPADNLVEMAHSSLKCPTLFVETNRFDARLSPFSARGLVTLQGDVARLRQWLHDPKQRPGEPLAGALSGQLDLDVRAGHCGLACSLQVKDLTAGAPANPTWREPLLRLAGAGAYETTRDELRLSRLHADGQYFSCEGRGKVARALTTMNLDLAGMLSYDLEKLEPHLRPLLGGGVKIAGRAARPFKVSGPLAPPPGVPGVKVALTPAAPSGIHYTHLRGEAGLSWESLRAYGCVVGPAEVRACLQQGWLQTFPIEATLNGGKLRLQPNLRLEPGPMELVLTAGPLVERAKITPEMCASALGYTLPALAHAAEAEGLVSVLLDGGRFPLSNPAAGNIKGTMVLHSARITPGPLVRELGTLMHTPGQVVMTKETRVPFQLVGGRVYHRDLELTISEFTVRTSGSVGLDGSLALLAEMPVPPRWVASSKLAPALAKQTIRLPIGGTIEQPRIDQAALRRLTAEFARDVAGETLRNELEKKLQGILRPRERR